MKKITLFLCACFCTIEMYAQSVPLLWESRYAGAGDNSDKFNKIISLPGGEYVAVGFTTRNGNYKDFLTVKLDSSLDTLWTRTKGINSGDDEAVACAVDGLGNIYVTGYRDGDNTEDDFYTVKYNASGTVLWDTAYNDIDSALLDDRPVDCVVDQNGHLIIAGWSEAGTWALNHDDYKVIKYDQNGNILWSTRYDRSGFKDEATAMAVDASGNIFVTGRSSNGSNDDWVTIKLDGATGGHMWIPVKIYTSGGDDDRPTCIALDNAGFPVIAGFYDNGGNEGWRIMKYSSAGVLQWNNFYNGPAQDDRALAIAINQTTNDVYVTGFADSNIGANLIDNDIVTRKYNASGGWQWSKTWSGAALNNDEPSDIAVDAFGNILVCGKTDADPSSTKSNYDWIVIKYDAAGIQQYAKTRNGSRNDDDEAASMVIHASGEAVVSGYINNTSAQKDASGLRYDAGGNETDQYHYNGEGDFNESAHAMVQDASGNTYIAGYTYTETDNRNLFAAKIDPSGNMVDTFMMNGNNDDDDELTSIAVDGNGNIFACGILRTMGEKSNFVVMRFNFQAYPAPDTLWSRTYNYIGQSDQAHSLVVDATGVYVTGESDAEPNDTLSNDDIVTIKYDFNGNVIWQKRYDAPLTSIDSRDQPVKIILGMNNRVYVTGRNMNIHDDDIVLLAYDRTTGDSISNFPQSWNSFFLDDDRAEDILEDSDGNIYISGYSQSGPFIEDYTILKYDSTGTLQWALGYDGVGNNEDRGNALALDGNGNVVLTGQTDSNNDPLVTNYDYGTFIYDGGGNYVCASSVPFIYNGTGNGDDIAVAVHVEGNDILVTGKSSEVVSTNENIMVRFYSQGACMELPEYAEYDGPAGGDDAPNVAIVSWPAIYIAGSSDGPDFQKDIIALKFDITTSLTSSEPPAMQSMVYPNPVTSVSRIYLDQESAGKAEIRIFNVMGEIVMQLPFISPEINAADFANGVYSYQVTQSGNVVAGGRFVVQE